MSAVAGQFRQIRRKGVLLTKQDETDASDRILNLALEHRLKPTFITNGQTVPDDIAAFRGRTLCRAILGASHE